MLGSNGKKKSQKNQYMGLIRKKKNFARAAHFCCTFLCRCFARLQRETSRNFLVTRFMKEILFLFTFLFVATHFHLGGR